MKDSTVSDGVSSSYPSPAEDDDALSGPFARASLGSANIWADNFHQMQTTKTGPVIGIGRQQRSGIGMWECLFNFEVAAADGARPGSCGVQCESEVEVFTHYAIAHHPVRLHEPPKWFKCRACGQWNDVALYCLQCEMVDFGAQEEWLCGFALSNRPLPTDGRFDVAEKAGESMSCMRRTMR